MRNLEPETGALAPAESPTESIDQLVRARQLQLAFDNARFGLFPLFVSVCCYTAVLANIIAPARLALWLVTMTALVALRGGITYAFTRSPHKSARHWVWLQTSVLALLGITYGITPLWIDLQTQEWLLAVANLWLGGLAVAAVIGQGIVPIFGAAFAVPVLLPLLLRLLLAGDPTLTAIGICNVLFYIYIFSITIRAQAYTLDEVRHRVEVQYLAQRLEVQRQHSEALVNTLKREVARRKRAQEALTAARNKARHQSAHDHLTGLANRRNLERVLGREWRRARRDQQPLSVILCDIDRFAAYNARYGHHAGDLCLARIARVLREIALRDGDLAARFGGEEFVVLLPKTGEYAALEIAEAIRAKIYDLTILHGASDAERIITASLGVATIIPNDSDREQLLLESAAHALKRAKLAGRNCVFTVYGRPAQDENL